MLLRRVAPLAWIAACGGGHASPDAAAPDALRPDAGPCVVGDPSQPIDLQVVTGDAGVLIPITDGGTLALEPAPQGGHIALVGARVKNTNLCNATVQGALIDTCNGTVLGIESRTVAWRLAADGYAEPAQPEYLSDYANVALCPNAPGLRADVDGTPARLELRYTDHDGHVTVRSLTVTPTCRGDAACQCECSNDPSCGAHPDAGACP